MTHRRKRTRKRKSAGASPEVVNLADSSNESSSSELEIVSKQPDIIILDDSPSPRPPSPVAGPRQPSPRPPRTPSPVAGPRQPSPVAQRMGSLCEYMTRRLPPDEIDIRRALVVNRYAKSTNLVGMNKDDLETLFNLYDDIFFENSFRGYFRDSGSPFSIFFSKTLTKTAGRCTRKPRPICEYSIEISIKIMAGLFSPTATGQNVHAANGLICRTRLGCLQLVLEHEMIHLLQFIYIACSSRQEHGPEFKTLVKNIFGHTETTHDLLNALTEEQAQNYSTRHETRKTDRETQITALKADLYPGVLVQFTKPTKFFSTDDVFRVITVNKVNLLATNVNTNKSINISITFPHKIVSSVRAPPAALLTPVLTESGKGKRKA